MLRSASMITFPKMRNGPTLTVPFGGAGMCGEGRKKAAHLATMSVFSFPLKPTWACTQKKCNAQMRKEVLHDVLDEFNFSILCV